MFVVKWIGWKIERQCPHLNHAHRRRLLDPHFYRVPHKLVVGCCECDGPHVRPGARRRGSELCGHKKEVHDVIQYNVNAILVCSDLFSPHGVPHQHRMTCMPSGRLHNGVSRLITSESAVMLATSQVS